MAHEMCDLVSQHKGVTHILMFGDHDADGEYAHVAIENYTKEHFKEHFIPHDMPEYEKDAIVDFRMEFEHCAVTQDQIRDLKLITRAPNKDSKRHDWWVEKFGEDEQCCEMDAIEVHDLQVIIRKAIMWFIPEGHIEAVQAKEKEHLELIRQIAAGLPPDGDVIGE